MEDDLPDFEETDDELSGYYDDDGNKVNPDLVPKPALCLLCVNDDDPEELVLCNLNRLDQAENEEEFKCGAYIPKDGPHGRDRQKPGKPN